VVLICFVISGACAAMTGILLSGWANRSYQAMGDPYLLPAIAAVVLGGANVLGGKGTYLGTVAGVILITLLQSILSVVQPQNIFAQLGITVSAEAVRQMAFGTVIIGMLLLYGREKSLR
jgi:ribose transport system permease protein